MARIGEAYQATLPAQGEPASRLQTTPDRTSGMYDFVNRLGSLARVREGHGIIVMELGNGYYRVELEQGEVVVRHCDEIIFKINGAWFEYANGKIFSITLTKAHRNYGDLGEAIIFLDDQERWMRLEYTRNHPEHGQIDYLDENANVVRIEFARGHKRHGETLYFYPDANDEKDAELIEYHYPHPLAKDEQHKNKHYKTC